MDRTTYSAPSCPQNPSFPKKIFNCSQDIAGNQDAHLTRHITKENVSNIKVYTPSQPVEKCLSSNTAAHTKVHNTLFCKKVKISNSRRKTPPINFSNSASKISASCGVKMVTTPSVGDRSSSSCIHRSRCSPIPPVSRQNSLSNLKINVQKHINFFNRFNCSTCAKRSKEKIIHRMLEHKLAKPIEITAELNLNSVFKENVMPLKGVKTGTGDTDNASLEEFIESPYETEDDNLSFKTALDAVSRCVSINVSFYKSFFFLNDDHFSLSSCQILQNFIKKLFFYIIYIKSIAF